MKKYGYFIFCFLLTACINRAIRPGIYYADNKRSSYNILANGKYEFNYDFEIMKKKSFGNWKEIANKNLVELNSYYQTRALRLDCIDCSLKDTLTNTILILNVPQNLNASYEFLFYLNDSLVKRENRDSIIKVDYIKKVDSLVIGITGKKSIPSRFLDTLFSTKYYNKSGQNFFTFNLAYNDSLFNYKVFTSKKIRYTRNGIIADGSFFKKR